MGITKNRFNLEIIFLLSKYRIKINISKDSIQTNMPI
jgi:hypothetical protein